MNYFLGIDIGTTAVKVIAFTEDGNIVARAQVAVQTRYTEAGHAEQNPDEVSSAVIQATAKLVQESNLSFAGLSFSCAMHGLICVNALDKRLTNCMLWSDRRSAEVASSLAKNKLGEQIFAETGTPLHPMSPLCKIRWLQENEKEIFRNTATFFDLKSWLIYKIFNQKLIDESMASATGLYSGKTRKWSDLALDFCGINAGQLPEIVPTHFVLPALPDSFCKKTGLAADCPAVIGASDGCLANLGAGALSPGTAALTIGTSAAIRTASENFSTAKDGSLFTYILEENIYLVGGAGNNGGNVAQWLSTGLLGRNSVAEVLEMSTKAPPGAVGLRFYPYLFGERAPLWDAAARASYHNISGTHEQEHFAKATIEGILFNLRLIYQNIEKTTGKKLNKMIAGGGFFRSSITAKLCADIFNIPIEIHDNHDNSAYGAVLLGMKALGFIEDYQEKLQVQKTTQIFYPETDYEDLFKTWKENRSS